MSIEIDISFPLLENGICGRQTLFLFLNIWANLYNQTVFQNVYNEISLGRAFMELIHAVLIFLGLSLDSFVIMMNKGATVRDLSLRKSVLYALIHVCTNILAVILGYGISFLLKGIMPARIQVFTACLIIFGMGVFLATRAWKYRNAEERLDRNFDWKRCLVLAAGTSIDTLFLAAGFSFYGIPLAESVLLAGSVTFITILTALRIGYIWGSGYSRPVAMAGGVLMAGFSVYLLSLIFTMGA